MNQIYTSRLGGISVGYYVVRKTKVMKNVCDILYFKENAVTVPFYIYRCLREEM